MSLSVLHYSGLSLISLLDSLSVSLVYYFDNHQGKALKEGFRERRWARTGVSSREEINTNRNLARVTTKSKSGMQAVSNGRVGR